MPQRFKVKLNIFRGAGPRPVGSRMMTVNTPSALDACCRAEDLVNIRVADNEYAAAVAVWPMWNTTPASSTVLAEAA